MDFFVMLNVNFYFSIDVKTGLQEILLNFT